MPHVLISGWYGHANAGDEAILAVFLEQFAGGREFTTYVLTSEPETVDRDHAGKGAVGLRHWEYLGPRGVENLLRARVGKSIRLLYRSRMLVFGGGSILRDNTSWTNLFRLLDDIFLARLFGVPVFFYALGVGPFRSWLGRRLIAAAARCATVITVRDRASAELLQTLGIAASRITIVTDPAFLLGDTDPSGAIEAAGLTNFLATHKRTVFVYPTEALVLTTSTEPEDKLIHAFAGALQTLAEQDGFAIVFIPMRVTGGNDDVAMGHRIQQLLPTCLPSHVVHVSLSPSAIRALTGTASVNLAVRLHAMIFAAASGVPSAAINYEPKVRANAEKFGNASYLVEPDADMEAGIVAAVRSLADNMELERNALAERLPELKTQALSTFASMARLLAESPERR